MGIIRLGVNGAVLRIDGGPNHPPPSWSGGLPGNPVGQIGSDAVGGLVKAFRNVSGPDF